MSTNERPQRVRIQCQNGGMIDCDLIRDDDTPNGNARWVAVPRQDYALRKGDRLSIGFLPPHCGVALYAPTTPEDFDDDC